MNNELLKLIHDYDNVRDLASTYGMRIISIICDVVRDIIPDIRGWVGDIDISDVLFFHSEKFEKRAEEMQEGVPTNWRRFYLLIELIFPELESDVDDDGIYLSPEEQISVLERLKKLRENGE